MNEISERVKKIIFYAVIFFVASTIFIWLFGERAFYFSVVVLPGFAVLWHSCKIKNN